MLCFFMYLRDKNTKADTLMILDSLCFLCLNNLVVPSDSDELTTNNCVIQRFIFSLSSPYGHGCFCSLHSCVLLLVSHCLASPKRYLDFSSKPSEELAGFRITAETVTKV